MGHAKVTTTLAIYTHLFADDHADAMAALGAMSRPVARWIRKRLASLRRYDDCPPGANAVNELIRRVLR